MRVNDHWLKTTELSSVLNIGLNIVKQYKCKNLKVEKQLKKPTFCLNLQIALIFYFFTEQTIRTWAQGSGEQSCPEVHWQTMWRRYWERSQETWKSATTTRRSQHSEPEHDGKTRVRKTTRYPHRS